MSKVSDRVLIAGGFPFILIVKRVHSIKYIRLSGQLQTSIIIIGKLDDINLEAGHANSQLYLFRYKKY